MAKWLQRISSLITRSLEHFFYFWGYNIAKRPWHFISGCIIFTFITCSGLLNFYRETRLERLFIPYMSNFYNTTVFLATHFPPPVRQQFAIVTADDVLQPQAIQKMLLIHQKVSNFTISSGKSWQDQCFKFPVVNSMWDDLELLKGFRNRAIMKREVGTSDNANSKQNMEALNMFEDDFIDGTFNQHFQEISNNSTRNKQVTKQHSLQSPGSSTSGNFLSDFSDFESEFGSDAFRNKITNITDFSVVMPSDLYCALVESVRKECWEFSLLELWNYDPDIIGNLTKEIIVHDLNTVKKSPVFGLPADYVPLLGNIKYDADGRIISATALMTIWHLEVDYSNIDETKSLLDTGLSEPADGETLEWEAMFVDLLLNETQDEELIVLVRAWRSVSDVTTATLFQASFYVFLGSVTMFIYIVVMMSDFNAVDVRLYSSMMGIVAVLLSFVCTIGLCSAFGVFFGPLHIYIGIILLGLGVDDMFVIAQSYNTLSELEKFKPLPEKIGLTLKHAGAAITVTSLTNTIAFFVGSNSIFPFLSSLCIYLAVGIIFLYIFQATFFVGFFTLEQDRISKNLNPVIVCYKHYDKGEKSENLSIKRLLQTSFDKISPTLRIGYVKIAIIAISIGLLGVSAFGLSQIDVKFQPQWLTSKDSYLSKFYEVFLTEIRVNGEEGMFILYNINYTSEMDKVEDIVKQINSLNNSIAVLDDWYTGFKHFVNTNFHEDLPNRQLPEDIFLNYLGKYLFSPNGAQHQNNFRFDETLVCGQPAPHFQVSLMPFRTQRFEGATEHVPGMQRIQKLVKEVTFKNPESWFTVWCYMFLSWESDQHVFKDTIFSLILATAFVFLCTLITLASYHGSLLVMSCVILTLVEVFGFLHLLDVEINILSSLGLVLSVGMSVDFAVHIVHCFLTINDSSKENRAVKAFRHTGPAVFNGGISTVIAYTFLIFVNMIGMDIFVKTFFLVVTFGMFNGLLLIPVLLSLIGPAPYANLEVEGKGDHTRSKDSTNTLLLERHKSIVISVKASEKDQANEIAQAPEEVMLNQIH